MIVINSHKDIELQYRPGKILRRFSLTEVQQVYMIVAQTHLIAVEKILKNHGEHSGRTDKFIISYFNYNFL